MSRYRYQCPGCNTVHDSSRSDVIEAARKKCPVCGEAAPPEAKPNQILYLWSMAPGDDREYISGTKILVVGCHSPEQVKGLMHAAAFFGALCKMSEEGQLAAKRALEIFSELNMNFPACSTNRPAAFDPSNAVTKTL